MGLPRGGKPFTGSQRRCLENKGSPVIQISLASEKASLVTGLFFVESAFPR